MFHSTNGCTSHSHTIGATHTYNAYLYINGVLNSSGTQTRPADINNNPFMIGAKSPTDRTRDFNGTIDEVGIWNRAITVTEAKQLYDYGRSYDENAETDFNFRMYSSSTGQFQQMDPLIPNVYAPQSINRCSFEENNPFRNVDPTGHFILGFQVGGEAALGSGAGYASGYIMDVRFDEWSFDMYKFETKSFGGGLGASGGVEGVFGPYTTAKDFSGKSYTFQGGFTPTASVGTGVIWSGNVPMDSNGQPKISKTYGTAGVGGIASVGGVQAYAGESDTKLTSIFSSKTFSNSKSSNANLASPFKVASNSKSTSSSSSSQSLLSKAQSTITNVINKFKSIFSGSKK